MWNNIKKGIQGFQWFFICMGLFIIFYTLLLIDVFINLSEIENKNPRFKKFLKWYNKKLIKFFND